MKQERLGWTLLAATMTVATVLLFWLQRDLAFDGDSVNWLELSGFGSIGTLLEPYGGHLIFTPLLLFKATIAVTGTSYTAFGVVQVSLLLLLGLLLYVYGKRRVGPLLALLGPVALLFLGSSWNVLMQPMIGIQFLCGLIPGLAALLALERDDRRGDVAACGLLTLGVLGFEMALAFVVGVAVAILLREDRRRRIWIAAVPALAYAAWKLWAALSDAGRYPEAELDPTNLLWMPAYVVDSVGVTVVSLFGLFYLVGGGQLTSLKLFGFDSSRLSEGVVLLVFEALAALWIVDRLRRRGPIPASFWAALAILITIWIEQSLALASNRTPGEIRYILPCAFFLLLFLLEAARGMRVTATALAVGAVLAAAMVLGNLARLQEGRAILTEFSPLTNASIAVLVLGGSNVPPDFVPGEDAPEAFPEGRGAFIGASKIQRIASELGSLGYSPGELRRQPAWVRRSADLVAAKALGLAADPAPGGCRPGDGADSATLPPGGAVIVSSRPSPLLLRRFASEFAVEVGRTGPASPVALVVPPDRSRIPWRVAAPAGGGLALCSL
jgi:hypothetical protein